uniref:Uncharacterized protein n=1 Tax=Zea mays TaxID=4577 RepID=C4J0X1_MAIZE|nr:unknown [Zea mays]ACR37354.1 unknown [Zea mays]
MMLVLLRAVHRRRRRGVTRGRRVREGPRRVHLQRLHRLAVLLHGRAPGRRRRGPAYAAAAGVERRARRHPPLRPPRLPVHVHVHVHVRRRRRWVPPNLV